MNFNFLWKQKIIMLIVIPVLLFSPVCHAENSESSSTDYKTSHFFIHSGAVTLNPYKIKKNEDDKFMLEESGETDTLIFIEALYRDRYAWLGKELKKWRGLDYEMRIGYTSTDGDSSGAVVPGAGDAYMEFSVGYLLLSKLKNEQKKELPFWSFNFETLSGFVTDKGSQDLHFYWGSGPVVAVSVPYSGGENNKKERRIEIVGGVYFGHTEIPIYANDETREIESKNDFPDFQLTPSAIWRGDIHFPLGENGFLTISSRFTSNLFKEGINPWNLAVGYTIPLDMINSLLEQ